MSDRAARKLDNGAIKPSCTVASLLFHFLGLTVLLPPFSFPLWSQLVLPLRCKGACWHLWNTRARVNKLIVAHHHTYIATYPGTQWLDTACSLWKPLLSIVRRIQLCPMARSVAIMTDAVWQQVRLA